MGGPFANGFWCSIDSIRYVIEHNPGSIVILVAAVGFLFWRIEDFVAQAIIRISRRAAMAALRVCAMKSNEEARDECAQDVVDEFESKVDSRFKIFLNVVAVFLIILGGLLCYSIVSPPVTCSIPESYGINVPAVFKLIQNKGGEFLYVDNTDRSYVRIWPGKDDDFGPSGPSFDNLKKKYDGKIKESALYMAPGSKLESNTPPAEDRRYFAVSWRDRDNFDVYFVARLVSRENGKSYIDSFEISSPVHGNALVGYDYQVLFCTFIAPTTNDRPRFCEKILG